MEITPTESLLKTWGKAVEPLTQVRNLGSFRKELQTIIEKDVPLLKEMAKLSLALIQEATKGKNHAISQMEATAGAEFIKKSLEIALQINSEEGPPATLRYLAGVAVYYGCVVAAPLEAARLINQNKRVPNSTIDGNFFLECYLAEATSGKPIKFKNKQRETDYKESLKGTRGAILKDMRGVIAELMAFCYCQKFNPQLAFVRQDVKGVDFYIGNKISIQVKSSRDARQPECEFVCEGPEKPHIRITLNPPPLFMPNGDIDLKGLNRLIPILSPRQNGPLDSEITSASKDFEKFHRLRELSVLPA